MHLRGELVEERPRLSCTSVHGLPLFMHLSNRALLQLNILDAAGVQTSVVTGPDWVLSRSPITADNYYNGEIYDARLESYNFSSWIVSGAAAAVVMPSPTKVLSSHVMPQIVAYETRHAVSVTALNSSSFLFDLGLNGAGVCTLTLPGPLPTGASVTITYAELVDPNGSGIAYVQFPCPSACCLDGGNCADQRFVYVTHGGVSNESYAQSFSYSGARYAQVDGWPSPTLPTADLLSCAITSTGVSTTGSVAFNGTVYAPILNAIQAAIVRSQRSNIHSIPTDCPQREKRGWMADAHVTAPEASLNLMMAPVYENWLRTHADTLAIGCGGDPLEKCMCPKWHADQPGNCTASGTAYGHRDDTATHPLLALAIANSSASGTPNCYFCCSDWDGFGCTPVTPARNASAGSISD